MRRVHPAIACSALAAALALIGCGQDQPEAPAEPKEAATTPAPASAAVVKASADKTHAVQPGDLINVTVEVDGFTLDPGAVGQANAEDVGYYRIYLDGESGEDHLAQGAAATVQVTIPEDITDGSHDLRVVLHNNDGTPVSPAAEASVLLIVYRL